MGNTTTRSPLLISAPLAAKPIAGHEFVSLRDLGMMDVFFGIMGGEGGYNTEGDLVSQTSDGRDLNGLWAEFQATLAIFNERRQTLIDLITYPVSEVIDTVPQVGSTEFEEASEFGEPQGARIPLSYFSLAYDFRDYDKATRYTWRFLRDATAQHLEALHNAMLDADNRLVFRKVMEAIFDNRNRSADINRQNFTVYPLYNADGTVPPSYKSTTFLGTHTHYITSGASAVNSDDVMDLYNLVAEHGFGVENGTTFVILANKQEVDVIRRFRFGVALNGATPAYDFIPSVNEPPLILPNSEGLLGTRPVNSYRGLQVKGSYADILIIQEDYIPAGYMLLLGSGGAGALTNPVGIREHANAAYRGLRLLPGNRTGYPLVDSFYTRGFGTGVRQRGGAAVMQVSANASYTIPAAYTRGTGLS